MLFAACADDGETVRDADLRPAEEVEAEAEAIAAPLVEEGEEVPLGDDVTITFTSVESRLTLWVEVGVRVENRGDDTVSMPEIGIQCAESDDLGGYLASSTILLTDEVPPASFREGLLHLEVPAGARVGNEPCPNPAFVRAQVLSGVDPRPAARLALRPSLVDALNARLCLPSRERGPGC